MSHVVINAITVPPEQHDAMAERFAKRAGMVEQAEGFERFSLLRPADGRDVWLVVTQWRDEAAFQAWMSSSAFGQQHGERAAQGPSGPSERAAQGPSGPSERAAQGPSGPSERAAQGPSGPSERASQGSPASGNEVWSFSVAQQVG